MPDTAPHRDAALVAVDWGTSAFRAWLLDDAGGVLDEVRSADGSLRTSAGAATAADRSAAFARTFVARCGAWLARRPGLPVVVAGMAGSDHGWADAGYLDVPVGLDRLAHHLTAAPTDAPAAGGVVHLVPGLRVPGRRGPGPDPDVLRGEEVQLLGALAASPDGAALPAQVVLPGTHAKWVRLDGGRVAGFSTAMTGEVFALLLRDSVLARLADGGPGPEPSPAFDRGLDAEAEHGDDRGLLTLLFTGRTLAQAGRLAPGDVADYVSGLLVGSEVRHALRSAPASEVAVGGEGALALRYRRALVRHGAAARPLGDDLARRGLWRVAAGAGLVAATAAPRTAAPATTPAATPTTEVRP
ncbi:2-dehydro-3-deoxygalactonokinase [Isoptericola sp. NPDC057559]|uniref:2-dehydro-3-deoxygalactonokinase n=1 Tax=Isoptericola sp. NPDC057559 TaxID=3346168 RepID=UPI0036A53B65